MMYNVIELKEVLVIIKVNLKEILKEKNMTLSDLSKTTGITMKTLSAFQNQKVESVQFNTIEQVTYALDISIEDLITKVVDNYEISVSFENIFNENSDNGIFIIKWSGNDLIHTTPVSFEIFKSNINKRKRIEFYIDSIDSSLPKNIFSIPEIPFEYFKRNNCFFNHNSYLELISYLLVQEYLYLQPDKYCIQDEFIVNVHNIVETYEKSSMGKDEARFSNVGNVFINNTYAYVIKLTALNNQLHLKSDSISVSDNINANIESLIPCPFIADIAIDEYTFKRKVYTMFD